MSSEDVSVTAGWGYSGGGDDVMPGQGRAVERPFISAERSAMTGVHAKIPSLGASTLDVCLNDHTFWCNVPLTAYRCKLLGSQVLKKWLSYQERGVLEQPLRAERVQHVADSARRIEGILKLWERGIEG